MNEKAKNLNHISHVLESSFKDIGLKARLTEYRICKEWRKAVGAKIAKKAQPSNLIRKTLYVTVVTSTWMQELKFLSAQIVEKLNTLIGEECIEDINFKIGSFKGKKGRVEKPAWHSVELSNEDKEKIKKDIAFVNDDDIKSTLLSIISKDKRLKVSRDKK